VNVGIRVGVGVGVSDLCWRKPRHTHQVKTVDGFHGRLPGSLDLRSVVVYSLGQI
jgi:hypothetical protein